MMIAWLCPTYHCVSFRESRIPVRRGSRGTGVGVHQASHVCCRKWVTFRGKHQKHEAPKECRSKLHPCWHDAPTGCLYGSPDIWKNAGGDGPCPKRQLSLMMVKIGANLFDHFFSGAEGKYRKPMAYPRREEWHPSKIEDRNQRPPLISTMRDAGHKSDASSEGMSTPLVEVRTSPYGGMGVFAKKRLSKGDVVLAEKPFLVVKGTICTWLFLHSELHTEHNITTTTCYKLYRAGLGRRRGSHEHEKRLIKSHSERSKPISQSLIYIFPAQKLRKKNKIQSAHKNKNFAFHNSLTRTPSRRWGSSLPSFRRYSGHFRRRLCMGPRRPLRECCGPTWSTCKWMKTRRPHGEWCLRWLAG
jgi:hypothetical protein